jgi:hydrogenase/urease accessory protein HupE
MIQGIQAKHADLIAILCLALVFMIVAAASVFAHDPGLSSAELKLEEKQLTAQLTFAREEIAMLVPLDTDHDGQITRVEFDSALPRLESIARESLIVTLDGSTIEPGEVSAVLGDSNALHFNLSFQALTTGHLQVLTPLLTKLARGHRQFLMIRDETGQPLGEKMLDVNHNSFETDLAALSTGDEQPRTFWQFLKLGVEHILIGFDHLAFLFALLLAGSSFREAAKIITSFTAAHSMTLALATLNLVDLPASIVEPMIAVSIVYVGVENVFRREKKWRWLLTFAFGLIHGFGFASVLRDLGIGSQGGGLVIPLLSFNLGVELGQIAITALVLPLIWKLRQQTNFVIRYAPACSLLVALAGGYWLIERTFL